jgi:hypothetical protein
MEKGLTGCIRQNGEPFTTPYADPLQGKCGPEIRPWMDPQPVFDRRGPVAYNVAAFA